MKIEVGEYVRTINGTIFKIIDGNSDNYDIDFSYLKLEFLEDEWFESNRYNDNGYFFNERNIIKHSKNIIDLIEVGDFVNGEYVMCVDEAIEKYGDKTIITECNNRYFGSQIIGIVTKEQFKNMEYRL